MTCLIPSWDWTGRCAHSMYKGSRSVAIGRSIQQLQSCNIAVMTVWCISWCFMPRSLTKQTMPIPPRSELQTSGRLWAWYEHRPVLMPLSSGCSCRAGSCLAIWDGKDLPTPGCSPGACGWELTSVHCGLLNFCLLPKVLGEPEPHQSSPRLVYSESTYKVGLGHALSLNGYGQNGISF